MRDVVYYTSQTIIPMVILTVCINIYFLTLHTNVGIVNVIANIFNIVIVNSYMDGVIETSNQSQIKMINVLNKLQENFSSMMDIFLNGMDENAIENYMLVEKDYATSHKKEFENIGNFINTLKISNYAFSLISIYILYVSSTKEAFVEGLLIFSFYLPVIQNLADDIPKFVTMIGNLKSLEKILEPKLKYEGKEDRGIHIYNSQGSIQFKDITFSYMKDKYNKTILSNFNLNIKAGERIAIVSESGTGKTTIMKLLLKFYKPTLGNILFNNINIDDLNTKDIRKEINYINQKTLLFNDTILNNMKYGNTKSDNDILTLLLDYDLLKIFNPKTDNMMECLHRMVEPNGVNISMGMQKIIFLIRGIMKENCSVYIFDEPLTSIDPDTRSKVLKMINNIVKEKTLIIITHDKEVGAIVNKTIKLADLMKK
jgi:ATP-binding cassette subfamily B protein